MISEVYSNGSIENDIFPSEARKKMRLDPNQINLNPEVFGARLKNELQP